jgi:hypothetical protein
VPWRRLRCFLFRKPVNQPFENAISVKTFFPPTIVTLSGQRLSNCSRACRRIHFSPTFLPSRLFSNIKACSRSSRTGYWAGCQSLPFLDPLYKEHILSTSFFYLRNWTGSTPRSLHACLCDIGTISPFWYTRLVVAYPTAANFCSRV